jgi:hypothetical protein
MLRIVIAALCAALVVQQRRAARREAELRAINDSIKWNAEMTRQVLNIELTNLRGRLVADKPIAPHR